MLLTPLLSLKITLLVANMRPVADQDLPSVLDSDLQQKLQAGLPLLIVDAICIFNLRRIYPAIRMLCYVP